MCAPSLQYVHAYVRACVYIMSVCQAPKSSVRHIGVPYRPNTVDMRYRGESHRAHWGGGGWVGRCQTKKQGEEVDDEDNEEAVELGFLECNAAAMQGGCRTFVLERKVQKKLVKESVDSLTVFLKPLFKGL